MAGMFTREHFEACRDRLTPDGVICQWLQAYSLSPADFRSVVRTFLEVFPGATLWEASEGVDYLLMARADGRRPAFGAAAAAMERTSVRDGLARAELKRPADLASRLVLDAASLSRFVAGAPVQVEDLPRLEFTAPLFLYRDTGTQLLAELEPARKASGCGLATTGPGELEQLERARAVGQLVRRARVCAGQGELAAADEALARAAQVDPGAGQVAAVWAPVLLECGRQARSGADLAAAARYFERYLELAPEDLGVRNDLGVQYGRLGDPERAAAAYREVLVREPGYQPAMRNLAVLAYEAGKLAEAVSLYEKLATAGGSDARVLNNLGICYMKLEKYPEALRAWRQALASEPGMERVRENIRIVEFLQHGK
jgi:tetratricopeptide (TPR) repeat protein